SAEERSDLPQAWYATLVGRPAARFLRELVFGAAYWGEEMGFHGVGDAIAQHGVADTLEALRLGGFSSDQSGVAWATTGPMAAMYPRLSRLRGLTVRVGGMNLGAIDLPSLRSFTAYTGGLGATNVRSVAAARWPLLESLTLYLGTERYGGGGTVE